MLRNAAKAKIKAGQSVIGSIVGFNSPHLVELCGRVGFDFVFIDGEHGAITPDVCEGMVRAAELVGLPSVVRVPANDAHVILRFLDTGATGVVVPHVRTREEALAAVAAVKYHPLGERSFAGGRAAEYGLGASAAEYMAFANEQTLTVVMVEDVQGLENLDDIVGVEGVDVIHVGPADLAISMGLPGQASHPEVQGAIDEVIRRASAAGKAVGVGGNSNLAGVKRNLARGVRFITLGFPGFFASAARELLTQARSS